MKKALLFTSLLAAGASVQAQTFVSTTPENRNAVLEEFTGIYCTFCPDGHRLAQELYDANPNDVVLINVHAGGYANPDAGDPDFRTAFGAGLDGQAGICGYPAGSVNRQYFAGLEQTDQNGDPCGVNAIAMSRGDWSGAAEQVIDDASPVNVAAQASIDLATRTLTVVVEAYYTGDSDVATNKLTVAVLENNVEGPQIGSGANPDQVLPNGNYNHKHMLRHFITGQWGATISTTTTGSFYTATYTWEIPEDLRDIPVKLGDLEVVVFVAEGNKDIITGSKAELAFISPNAYDALPYAVTVPNFVCGNELEPVVTVQNFGSEPLTSLDILYSVNGGPVTTYEWTGSLTTAATTNVTLPVISFTNSAENLFWVATQSPNGQGDQVSANDIQTVEFLPAENSGTEVTITIVTDNYGSETTWRIVGPNGNTVLEGGPYTDAVATFTESVTLSNGCHEFIIEDLYGDGICCQYGTGSFTIVGDGVTVYTGGEFGSEEVRLFNVGGTAGVEEVEVISGLSVYPNPFATDATIQFSLKQNGNVALSVRNVLGETVLDRQLGTMTAGDHNYRLSSEGLSSGIYLVSLLVDGQQQTSRISISK